MYVYIYIYIYISMYIYMDICVCICRYTSICIYVCICMCIHVYICMFICLFIYYKQTHLYTCTYMYMQHVYVCICQKQDPHGPSRRTRHLYTHARQRPQARTCPHAHVYKHMYLCNLNRSLSRYPVHVRHARNVPLADVAVECRPWGPRRV